MDDAVGQGRPHRGRPPVSFEEKHLAILRLEVTVLNADAPVTITAR
jgi:hypothetical protein